MLQSMSVLLAAAKVSLIALPIIIVAVFVMFVVALQVHAKRVVRSGSAQRSETGGSAAKAERKYDSLWEIRFDTLYSYKGNAAHVVVPEGVEEVFVNAFAENQTLESIVLPQSLKEIHSMAFRECPNLREVVLPDHFDWDETSCYFTQCSNLSAVTYHGVRYTDFVVDNGVLLLCLVKDQNVQTPQGVYRIGGNAFVSTSNESYYEVRVSEGVTEIGEDAFSAVDIKRLILPSTLQTFAEGAITFCPDLEWVDLAGVAQFDDLLIFGDIVIAALGNKNSYTVPEGVKRIGNYAFGSPDELTSLTLPESLESIGNKAFAYCRYLTRLTVPQGVQDIGEAAFGDWCSDQVLEIPQHFESTAKGDDFWNEDCEAEIVYY